MEPETEILCPCGCGYPMPAPLNEEDMFNAGAAMEEWIRTQGITMEELREDNRLQHMVEARRRIAAYLRAHHWSLTRIGHFLDRDHTTVLHLLRKGVGWANNSRNGQRVPLPGPVADAG